MIHNKAIWQRALVIFSVFSFCMSMLGSLPESLRYGYELEAAADDVVHQLTAEQTLALYGRTLSGSWYNAQDGLTRSIDFHYAFTSRNWAPQNYTEFPTYIKSLSFSYTNNGNVDSEQLLSKLQSQTFLIYYSDINPDNNNSPWYSSTSSNHANVNLNFSVSFPEISLWNQYFLWASDTDSHGSSGSYRYSYVRTSFTGLTDYYSYPYYGSTSTNRLQCALLPWYRASSQNSVSESKLFKAAIIHSTYGLDGNYYSLRGQDLVLQNFQSTSVDSSSELPPYSNLIGNSNVLILLISCPQLSGINVFPETTTAITGTSVSAGTTVSYQTYPTVDLSGLESGVGTMVQMQDENNYYERIQIDQLNMIIAQLNAIYAAMVERGEVPVSLTGADSYPTLNDTVLSGVNDAITTYTMAQLPADQIGNGATGLTSFMFFLNSGPWMAIGLFFIGFAIFSWFIFRGRGI